MNSAKLEKLLIKSLESTTNFDLKEKEIVFKFKINDLDLLETDGKSYNLKITSSKNNIEHSSFVVYNTVLLDSINYRNKQYDVNKLHNLANEIIKKLKQAGKYKLASVNNGANFDIVSYP